MSSAGRKGGCDTALGENGLIDYRWHQTVDSVLQNYSKEPLACRLNVIIISCPSERLKNKSSLRAIENAFHFIFRLDCAHIACCSSSLVITLLFSQRLS